MYELQTRPLMVEWNDTSNVSQSPTMTSTNDGYLAACAARLFLRDGIASVGMEDVAQAADVDVATVYRHFSTKETLTTSAATLLWSQFNDQIGQLVESDDFLKLNGLGRLRLLLEAYCSAYVAHADFVSFIDEFDRMVIASQVDREDLTDYEAQIASFYPIFEEAYFLGRVDGSIARSIDFEPFYRALAHALMGAAVKLRRGEVLPSEDFSTAHDELECLVSMAIWSLEKSPSATA